MTLAERVSQNAKEYAQKLRGKEWRKQLKGYWRASSMGLCARQQAYDYMGSPTIRTESLEKSWSLEDGHLQEGDIIKRICELPSVSKISENEVIKKSFKTATGVQVKIAGTPDLLISDGGEKVAVEIKALQDYAFKEVVRKNEAPDKYKKQLFTYMLLHSLKRGILFIKNRNTSEVISFEYTPDPKELKDILARQLKIQKIVDKGELPQREYLLGSQECFYCPHNKKCHEGQTFKGYVHKKENQKDIQVDLTELPEVAQSFVVAAKTYEKVKREVESLTKVQDDIKEKLEEMLKEHKADGLYAEGYSAKRIFSETDRPDNTIIKKLVSEGVIPVKKSSSSYIRVDLPKVKAKVAEDEE